MINQASVPGIVTGIVTSSSSDSDSVAGDIGAVTTLTAGASPNVVELAHGDVSVLSRSSDLVDLVDQTMTVNNIRSLCDLC